jgi:chromate transporter
VVIAVVVHALWSLGRTAVKRTALAVLAAVAIVLAALGVHELVLLLAVGVAAGLAAWTARGRSVRAAVLALVPALPAAAAAPFSSTALFLFFLKVGSVLYGSGYVLLAFLRADLVERWHWLTEAQLLDAVAVGQVTPGPVFTTATFVGYLLGGVGGAALATLGIFLPAFLFVAVSGPLVTWLRRSPIAGAFLDGVNVASLALMTVVTWHLGRSALVDLSAVLLAAASALLLVRFRVNSAWLVLGGAVLGLFRSA